MTSFFIDYNDEMDIISNEYNHCAEIIKKFEFNFSVQ